MPGPSRQEGNIIMVIKRKAKKENGPRVWLAKDFRVGEVERPEEAETDLFDHWPVTAPNGDVLMLGKSASGWYVFDPDGETGWEALNGWVGYTDQSILLRDLGRHLTADLVPVPKLPSIPDPHKPDCYLVAVDDAPYHARFPIMASADSTYYRIDKATDEVVCLVSIDTEGVHLAWDRCSECSVSIANCKCRAGIRMPRSIEWCLERSANGWADMAAYKRSYVPTTGSNDLPTRGTRPTSASQPRKTVAPAPVAVKDKPAPQTTAQDDAAMAELDTGNFDLSNLQSVAEEAATKAVRKVIKRRRK